MTDLEEQLTDPDYAGPMQHLRDWSDLDRLHADAATEIARLRLTIMAAYEDMRDGDEAGAFLILRTAAMALPSVPPHPR